MGYRSLREAVDDLERHGQLRRVDAEIDPHLEMGMIQRRVWAAGGPALLFTRPKGSAFPMLANLFGTLARARFLFRDSLDDVQKLVELKLDPMAGLRHLPRFLDLPKIALHLLPEEVRRGPVLARELRVSELPRLVSWPRDGGPFVTLPQVYTEDPDEPGWRRSNLGMYRVQLGGNAYEPDREIGLHYQIHRGIGVHHAAAIRRGERLRVSVMVGGPPAMTLAAVMPLPEGLPELAFAGALNRARVRLAGRRALGGLPVNADADFCVTGTIGPSETKPEGPFGDHLGYYSLAHGMPVMRVERVFARDGAIWPFTTVGRPPQEDTTFGDLIHELTGPLVPAVLPGVRAVHAVDAAGVHPLLLAIGSERYVPYAPRRRPAELLTQANAILGQGQMSLAKYLFIVAGEDAPGLDAHDVPAFFAHLLARFDPRRDLHFQTETTIDTLDYSGGHLNEGSKLVVAACGPPVRRLGTEVPALALPPGFAAPRLCMPGVLAIDGPAFSPDASGRDDAAKRLAASLERASMDAFPLVVLVDDGAACARTLASFLWTTFTRSNPAADVHGAGAFTMDKHWGCAGPLVIDARAKPHHAPALEEDPALVRRVESMAARGGPLAGLY